MTKSPKFKKGQKVWFFYSSFEIINKGVIRTVPPKEHLNLSLIPEPYYWIVDFNNHPVNESRIFSNSGEALNCQKTELEKQIKKFTRLKREVIDRIRQNWK